MAILKPDQTKTVNNVKVNEYLLTEHNSRNIAMPSASMEGKVIGVTIHNTDWITTAEGTTPAEQYTRSTVNGNMGDVRVHYYVDNTCAWQNLPLNLSGWHAADGDGDGNRRTIAIECIMSGNYNANDEKSEDNAARLAAALLKQYGLGIDRLYTHRHWYSKKYCPAYILPHWDEFKKKVETYLNSGTQTATTVLYRVRKSWADVKSQTGAYSDLEHAKNACPDGYSVYDPSGKAVYSKTVTVSGDVTVKVKAVQPGDEGSAVKVMQAVLIAKGYSCGSSGADGKFGNGTASALEKFQKNNKLAADKICGTETWTKLLA